MEAVLVTHEVVLEAAVVGCEDEDRLVKPMAYVVLKPGRRASGELLEELKQHAKSRLAPFKYPRWVEFIEELPKTAPGRSSASRCVPEGRPGRRVLRNDPFAVRPGS